MSCQGTVPEAIICFLDSCDYEECIRLAITLGGDADTLGTIAGAMAGAWYGGVPETIAAPTRAMLPEEFLGIIERFGTKFGS